VEDGKSTDECMELPESEVGTQIMHRRNICWKAFMDNN